MMRASATIGEICQTDPPEDNFLCFDQELTDTGYESFLDRDQQIDRLCRSIEFMTEDHDQECQQDPSIQIQA
jgi:hypothetical protein